MKPKAESPVGYIIGNTQCQAGGRRRRRRRERGRGLVWGSKWWNRIKFDGGLESQMDQKPFRMWRAQTETHTRMRSNTHTHKLCGVFTSRGQTDRLLDGCRPGRKRLPPKRILFVPKQTFTISWKHHHLIWCQNVISRGSSFINTYCVCAKASLSATAFKHFQDFYMKR